MSCNEIIERLNDFIDGELPADQQSEVQAHLAHCEACHREWQALSRLIHQAAALAEEEQPTRDLWPAIAHRARSGRETLVSFQSRRPTGRPSIWLAAAAVLFLSLSLVLLVHHAFVSAPSATAERSSRPDSDAATVQAAYLSVDQNLAATRTQLRQLLEQRSDDISPATMAVVSENLAIIEDSIVRIANALHEEPANPELHRMLLAACRSELRLLQQATTMPTQPHES